MKKGKKKFRLYWIGGRTEIVEGDDIADAFTHAGYGAGAIRALDYSEEIKTSKKEKNEDKNKFK